MNSERLMSNDILSQLQSGSELKTALEYGELLSLPNPSDEQLNRVEEILEQALDNSILHFWLTEMDHFIGHHLGLLDEDDRESYKDQQALIREYLGNTICQASISEEVKQSIAASKQEIWRDFAPEQPEEDCHDEATLNEAYH